MLAVANSATTVGIEAVPVQVEVDIAGGLPGFATVGLPENSVREARVRVQAAIGNSDFAFPTGKISVNLAPAHLRKEGTGFDLPIALAILAAAGTIKAENLEKIFVLGELSLSGEIQPVRGVLAAAEVARKMGALAMLVAPENSQEASLVKDLCVRQVRTFRDIVDFIQDGDELKAPKVTAHSNSFDVVPELDLADVQGQYAARRALEIAAAGGHNLLFVGGPGSGKTMMARRLSGILPPLTYEEALDVTRIHSVAGLTVGAGLVTERPFRAPHHSTTRAGLVGGGSGIPRPGELSLATHGVLFLDELPEFPRTVLEVLRQPLESGEVVISRAMGSLRYPTKFMLIAAMNPCPCGNFGTPKRICRCSSYDVMRYKARLSGPLLDRIDLHVEVPPVEIKALQNTQPAESSTSVRARVCQARQLQHKRLGTDMCNAQMPRSLLLETATPTLPARNVLKVAMERLGLSARAYDRVLRVARTIADLEGVEQIDVPQISEAIQYRGQDSKLLAA